MTCCEAMHKRFDSLANGEVQVGELPESTRVTGRVAWYVYQGAYREMTPKGWELFWRKFTTANLKMEGAPGDVYVCNPGCHKEDREEKMLTILWAPVA